MNSVPEISVSPGGLNGLSTVALPKRKPIDWERIEAEYRVGMLSAREIARINGLASETSIRKRAKRDGWERDLKAKVNAKVRNALVRLNARAARTENRARTIEHVTKVALATKIEIQRSHITRAASAMRIVEMLQQDLMYAIANRDEIEAEIDIATASDLNTNRRNRMKRAVSLASHAAAFKDLVACIAVFVKIERQAYGLTDGDDPFPKAHGPDREEHRRLEIARIDSLADKLREVLARPGSDSLPATHH